MSDLWRVHSPENALKVWFGSVGSCRGGGYFTADALFDLLSLTPLLSTMIVVNVDTAEVSALLAPVLRSLQ